MEGSKAKQDAILQYNSDIINFGAFFVLSTLMKCVPKIMTLLQGGSQWAADLRGRAAGDSDALRAIDELIALLVALQKPLERESIVGEAVTACKAQQDMIIDRSVNDYKEMTAADAAKSAVRWWLWTANGTCSCQSL